MQDDPKMDDFSANEKVLSYGFDESSIFDADPESFGTGPVMM